MEVKRKLNGYVSRFFRIVARKWKRKLNIGEIDGLSQKYNTIETELFQSYLKIIQELQSPINREHVKVQTLKQIIYTSRI